jgi:predicted nuclease of predicted toxin-antitoxin system
VKFHANENIEAEVVAFLRRGGHDVTYAAEVDPRASDEEVLSRAAAEGRILLTCDKDFGELCFRRGEPVSGVVLIRGRDATARGRVALLERLFDSGLPMETGRFIVVTDRGVRWRPLPGSHAR